MKIVQISSLFVKEKLEKRLSPPTERALNAATMKRIFDTITQHNTAFLVLSIIFAVPFLCFLPRLKTVDNVDYFNLKNDPTARFYAHFKKIFGNDEFFVIAFEKNDLFTTGNLTLLKNITRDLEALEDIREVRSLANAQETLGGSDYFAVRDFLEEIPDNATELAGLKKRALNNPLFVKNLISPDGNTVAIVVSTYAKPDDGSYRKRLVANCRKVLEKYRNQVNRFYMAGWTTIDLNLSQYMKKDIATFIPITYFLIMVTILSFFRNTRLTLLAMANITLCMGSTMGLSGMMGIRLNNVTTIVPPLVMALALCDTVHIFSHLENKTLVAFPDKRTALSQILCRLVAPCFLTTLTTAIGFLSLAVSKLPPIREFAWLASAGMVFEFIFSFFFLPSLLLFFKPEKIYRDEREKRGMSSLLTGLNGFVRRFGRILVFGCIALTIISFWAAAKIRVETNLLDYFKKDSPVRQSIAFVEKRLSGVSTLDISLSGEEDAFKKPANLKAIDRIERYVKSLDGVDVCLSFTDFLKDMNQAFHNENPHYYKVPETKALVSQYLLLYDSDQIADFVSDSYDHARISVRMSNHTSTEHEKIIRKTRKLIDNMPGLPLRIRLTGRAVQDVNIINALVKGQIYSLALAAIIITIIMFLALRSFSTGLLSIAPNIFPIALNFGIMGAVGIPLNTATALIAAVALGIAVDDTIHFLSEYRRNRLKGIGITESTGLTIVVKGRAMIASSLILSIGFGVLILSRFVPTIYFGALSAIIMLTALIGDMIFLPALLYSRRQKSTS